MSKIYVTNCKNFKRKKQGTTCSLIQHFLRVENDYKNYILKK